MKFPHTTVTTEIVHLGGNTAGEGHLLGCFVTGTDSFVTYQWLDNHGTPVINDDSIIIYTFPTFSALGFSPLHQSHGGTYTCSATIDGSTESKSANLNVDGMYFMTYFVCMHGEEEELLLLDHSL